MYVTYINLPRIPQELLDEITDEYILSQKNNAFPENDPKYKIMKHIYSSIPPTDNLNQWCKENICKSIKWFVQVIRTDLPMHKDIGATIKFNYIFNQGNEDVETTFYEDDKETILHSEVIMPHRWHMFKVDTMHRAWNLTPGKKRLSISGCIF